MNKGNGQPAMAPDQRPSGALIWIFLPLFAFAWFWVWRSNQYTGGDSEYWEREIAWGRWWRKRQMFSFATLQLFHRMGGGVAGWSSRTAINFVSCVSGALALLAMWRMTRDRKDARWQFAIMATAGFTTIFYGHIETYAMPAAALLLHLLAVQRSVEGRWPPWTLMATFTLALAYHLVILFILPAVLLSAILETRRRGLGRRGYLSLALGSLPGVLFMAALLVVDLSDTGANTMVRSYNFVAPPLDLLIRPWLIVQHETFGVKLKFAYWNAGFGALLAPAVMIRAGRDRLTLYLAGYFLCLLVFTAIWDPHARESDFDLFCFPWIVAVVAAAPHVMGLPWRSIWVGLALGVGVHLWLVRPVAYSDIGRRGHGTIEFQARGDAKLLQSTIDERLPLQPVNRYLPIGGRLITVRVAGRPPIRRVVAIRGDDRYRIRYESGRLEIEMLN